MIIPQLLIALIYIFVIMVIPTLLILSPLLIWLTLRRCAKAVERIADVLEYYATEEVPIPPPVKQKQNGHSGVWLDQLR